VSCIFWRVAIYLCGVWRIGAGRCLQHSSGFGASMRETVRDCAGIVRDFSRIPEHAIPRRVLRDAKGIAVLRVLKGGFVLSGRAGEGVVIARLPGGAWSGPSAIGTGGAGFGPRLAGRSRSL